MSPVFCQRRSFISATFYLFDMGGSLFKLVSLGLDVTCSGWGVTLMETNVMQLSYVIEDCDLNIERTCWSCSLICQELCAVADVNYLCELEVA